jgi:hypothetical protein
MPKQQLDIIDYFGPLAGNFHVVVLIKSYYFTAAVIFASILFILSVTVILHCLTTKNDDPHVFQKWGLGPKTRKDSRIELRGQPIKSD